MKNGAEFMQLSGGILEIIYFLEDEFGIEVKDDEMIPENLDSILQIT